MNNKTIHKNVDNLVVGKRSCENGAHSFELRITFRVKRATHDKKNTFIKCCDEQLPHLSMKPQMNGKEKCFNEI